MPERTRGPFEPLVSSGGPPGAGDSAEDSAGDTAQARAQKLEQIKDLYLTAEAIGEANVDKHFDQLLAQQRELIGGYFSSSAAAGPPAGYGAEAEAGPEGSAEPGEPGPAGPADAPEQAADRPRVS